MSSEMVLVKCPLCDQIQPADRKVDGPGTARIWTHLSRDGQTSPCVGSGQLLAECVVEARQIDPAEHAGYADEIAKLRALVDDVRRQVLDLYSQLVAQTYRHAVDSRRLDAAEALLAVFSDECTCAPTDQMSCDRCGGFGRVARRQHSGRREDGGV